MHSAYGYMGLREAKREREKRKREYTMGPVQVGQAC